MPKPKVSRETVIHCVEHGSNGKRNQYLCVLREKTKRSRTAASAAVWSESCRQTTIYCQENRMERRTDDDCRRQHNESRLVSILSGFCSACVVPLEIRGENQCVCRFVKCSNMCDTWVEGKKGGWMTDRKEILVTCHWKVYLLQTQNASRMKNQISESTSFSEKLIHQRLWNLMKETFVSQIFVFTPRSWESIVSFESTVCFFESYHNDGSVIAVYFSLNPTKPYHLPSYTGSSIEIAERSF